MTQILRMAVAQSPGGLRGPQARLQWLEEQLSAHPEPQLWVLPELFQCGYHAGDALLRWAEAEDGEVACAMAQLAKRYHTAIHYGFAERAGSELYNSAQCFGPDGQRLGHHRKLLLPPGFEGTHFQRGEQCQLFSYAGFRIATLICYDAEFPETFRHVVAQGADLVLVPTALAEQWPVVARCVIPCRAFENGVYVAYANHAGEERGLNYLGESCVVAPDGEVLARAGETAGVIVSTLDLGRVETARARLPYAQDRQKLQLN